MSNIEPAKGSTRALVALLAFVLGFATVPHRVCERGAAAWLGEDHREADALANSVARWTEIDLSPARFATGSSRFDGEWLFATYMMAAMGFGQLALVESEKAQNIERMEHCLDAMLEPRVRTFEEHAWGDDALTTLEPGPKDHGHIAFLGYAGLALAFHRMLVPQSRWNEREEAILSALERRIGASPTGFVETYPGEVYPVDNSAAFAAIGLHDRKHPALRRGLDALHEAIDRETGLLAQAVSVADAKPRDLPRASGTALAAYFLSFADVATSRALFHALERRQFRTVLGFGGVMEFPSSVSGRKKEDIDSGLVFLGFGVSATGFMIGVSRIHEDPDMFTALYATTHLFGAPLDENGMRAYATGGPIGDAILFAMLTARPLREKRFE